MKRAQNGQFLKGEKPLNYGRHYKIKNVENFKGRIPWNKNKTNCFSKETRYKMRTAKLGKIITEKQKMSLELGRKNRGGCKNPKARLNPQIFKKGELHPFWRGYSSRRRAVGGFCRDVCVRCVS